MYISRHRVDTERVKRPCGLFLFLSSSDDESEMPLLSNCRHMRTREWYSGSLERGSTRSDYYLWDSEIFSSI